MREPIILRDEVFDMKGKEYRGDDRDSQREDGEPLFILKENAVLKNGTISHSLEGVWFHGTNSRVENVVFPDVYEDAVSTRSKKCAEARGRKRNRIVGCYFANFSDKAIQQNHGELEVRDCVFVDGPRPIRQMGGSDKHLVTRVYDNRYYRTQSMAKADGLNPKSRVYHRGNDGWKVNPPPWDVTGKTRLIRE